MSVNKQLSNHSTLTFSHSLPVMYKGSSDDDCLYSHSLPCLGEVCGDTSEHTGDNSNECKNHSLKVCDDACHTNSDNDKESTKVVQIEPCPLQQKVERILKSSDKESVSQKVKKTGTFQWILRLAGLSFALLSILLLVVLLVIPYRQGKSQAESSAENIFAEKNLISFVNTKFRAPATDLHN